MQNVTATVKGTKLVIECSLDAETTASATGKTQVLASTRGNAAITTPKGIVYLGLNLYRK
jgi:hypothetical protein